MAKDFLTRHRITRRAIEFAAPSSPYTTEQLRAIAADKTADPIDRKAAKRVVVLRDRRAGAAPSSVQP